MGIIIQKLFCCKLNLCSIPDDLQHLDTAKIMGRLLCGEVHRQHGPEIMPSSVNVLRSGC